MYSLYGADHDEWLPNPNTLIDINGTPTGNVPDEWFDLRQRHPAPGSNTGQPYRNNYRQFEHYGIAYEPQYFCPEVEYFDNDPFVELNFRGRSSYLYRLTESGYASMGGGVAFSTAPNYFLRIENLLPDQWLLFDADYSRENGSVAAPADVIRGTRSGSFVATNMIVGDADDDTAGIRHGALNVAAIDASVKGMAEGEYLDVTER
jgi:hypothetical protein